MQDIFFNIFTSAIWKPLMIIHHVLCFIVMKTKLNVPLAWWSVINLCTAISRILYSYLPVLNSNVSCVVEEEGLRAEIGENSFSPLLTVDSSDDSTLERKEVLVSRTNHL